MKIIVIRKIIGIFEISLVFTLILAQIWRMAPGNLLPAATAMIVVLASWAMRGHNLNSLGLLNDAWSEPVKLASALFLFLGALTLGAARAGGIDLARHFGGGDAAILFRLAAYLFWAMFQELLLNGYFSLRFSAILGNKPATAGVAGLVFAIVHVPNPFLMAVTFVGGILSSCVFLNMERRNLYVIAFAHAMIGMFLVSVLPASLTHHLIIGPAFYR